MDVNIKQAGGGDQSPVPAKKPRFKLNKKTLMIIGVAGVVVFVIILKLTQKSSQTDTVVMSPYGEEYGSNQLGISGSTGSGTSDDTLSYVSDALNVFTDSLAQQNEKFETMNEANKDMFNYFGEQLQGLLESTKEPTSTVPESKPTNPPLSTGTTETTNTGLLMSGTYKTSAQADRVAGILSSTYGAKDAYVTKDASGLFRVMSSFDSTERANKVATRLQDRNLLSTVYTGSNAGSLQAVKQAAGFLQTGTFANKAQADKVAALINKDYGGTGTKVVEDGGKYRVQSTFANANRSTAVLNRLQQRKVIQTGTAGKVN